MSSFVTYLIGFVVLIVGLAYAGYLLNVPSQWLGVGIVVLLGAGIVSATRCTKMRDPAEGVPPSPPSRTPPTSPTA